MTTPEPEPDTGVVNVLEDALDRHGILDGEILHDEFANPKHPLHYMLEWDDTVAGHAYRVQQINGIIRRCYITFIRSDDERGRVRRYTPVRYTGDSERLRGYTRMTEAVANPLQAKALLREYRVWLKQGQERFGNLQEFVELMQSGEANTG